MRRRFMVLIGLTLLVGIAGLVLADRMKMVDASPLPQPSSIDKKAECTISIAQINQAWTLNNETAQNIQLQHQLTEGGENQTGCVGFEAKDMPQNKTVSIAKRVTGLQPGARYSLKQYYSSNAHLTVYAEAFKQDTTSESFALLNVPDTKLRDSFIVTAFQVPAGTTAITFYTEMAQAGKVSLGDYEFVMLPQVAQFDEPLVSITFDDGLASNYTQSLGDLEKYNMKSTFFINYGFLGKERYMTKQQVKDLSDKGHDVQSHSYFHDDLVLIDRERLAFNLQQNRSQLEKLIGKPVSHFATPFSSYTWPLTSDITSEYRSHRVDSDQLNTAQNLLSQQVYARGITKDTTTAQLSKWLEEARQKNGWLVLTYHGVEAKTDVYTITPKAFAEHIETIKQSGIKVVTYADAHKKLTSR